MEKINNGADKTNRMTRRDFFKASAYTLAGVIAAGHIGDKIMEANSEKARSDRNIALFKETGQLYSEGIIPDTKYEIVGHGPEGNRTALLRSPEGKLIITEIPELTRLPEGTIFILESTDDSDNGYSIKVVNR